MDRMDVSGEYRPPSKQWLEARDYFLGRNYASRDIEKAFALARRCGDADARFLLSLFPEGTPDESQVKAVLAEAGKSDPRALCWSHVFPPVSTAPLLDAADRGDILAQAWVCGMGTKTKHDRSVARSAAEMGEPFAMMLLADSDEPDAMHWMQRGAMLGNVVCMAWLAQSLPQGHERIAWMCKAAARGRTFELRNEMELYWLNFVSGNDSGRSVFEIGRALRGQPKGMMKSGQLAAWHGCIDSYIAWEENGKREVITWTLCARALRLHKDVTALISRLIWQRAKEGNYEGLSDDELAEMIYNFMQRREFLAVKGDVILCFGSNDLRVADHAAWLWKEEAAPLLLFSGKEGRGTEGLFVGRIEAEAFAERANAVGVPSSAILLEKRATNSGENVVFPSELLREKGIEAKRLIVVHKPYMEKRAYATLMKQWPGINSVTSVQMSSPEISWLECAEVSGRRDIIDLMVGDVQRLRLYAQKGFQIYTHVPETVWNAHLELIRRGYDRCVI